MLIHNKLNCIAITLCIFEASKIHDSLRYFIEIAYNGKNYHGWQKQPDAITVQEVIENALSLLLRKKIEIFGAGRTDAGVHAIQMFAHFNIDKIENIPNLIFKLNSFLASDVSVQNIFEVNENAHARFDAKERAYEYVITMKKNPFSEDFSYLVHYKPNIDLMNKAASLLLNYKDFQCFSRSNTDVKTYNCEIKRAAWTINGDKLIFNIVADRFLRNMVRAIVGTLLDVGFEKTTINQFIAIIESKDRSNAGASAPAKGLYLTKVMYPESIKL